MSRINKTERVASKFPTATNFGQGFALVGATRFAKDKPSSDDNPMDSLPEGQTGLPSGIMVLRKELPRLIQTQEEPW